MKLRISNKALAVILLLSLASPALADTPATINTEANAARVQQLQNRLEEIKAMDTRVLSRPEKKSLRREVREIKKELAAISGGVYLSVGALILIALLLILLL
ncbi:MAG TPA: hypothetical protein VFT90_11955 [Chryseosolibacter sp.]|nr:hypothetical protein [Chryseosolibacter sp.]